MLRLVGLLTGTLLVSSAIFVAASGPPAGAAVTPAGLDSASTGKVTVTIEAPKGVPANVALAGPAKALFAKPVAGQRASISHALPRGHYRVVPQAVVFGGVLYDSAPHASVLVSAGRTTRLTVKFGKVASASSLHATAISSTKISLAWSAPGGATFALRRAAGSTPPSSRTAGHSVRVSGRSATDSGLAAGKQYSYALFTHLDGRWAGPVTLLTGTTPKTGSTTASYAAVPGTVLPTAAQVQSSAPTGSGLQVTLRSSVPTPVIGSTVVLPPSASLPGGYIGQVSGISVGGSTLSLAPASLSDAFSYYNVDVPDFATDSAALTPRSAPHVDGARPRAAADADCGGSSSGTVTFSPSLRLGGSFHATINTTSHVHIPTGASLSMQLTATVTGAMSVSTSASLSCEISFGDYFHIISADPVPIAVSFSPSAEVSVEGEQDVSNIGATVTGGVKFSGSFGIRSGAHFTGSDILTAQPLTPEVTQSGEIEAKLGGQVIVGPGAGDDDAGVIAGVSGEFDPIDASYGPLPANSSCFKTSVGLLLQLALTAKAWLGSWSVDRNVTFSALTANPGYGGSPWYSPAGCQNSQPLSVAGGDLPDGQVSTLYDQFLSASGGTAPYDWTITDGSLPPGITLSDAGELTGTPISPGTFQFTAEATDSDDNTASGSFSLTVNPVVTAPDAITEYDVSPDLGCAMYGSGDSDGEFYGDTACGTIISTGGSLYGPADIPAGESLTGAANYNAWDPISQATTGSGTSDDPYITTTSASADGSPITVSQTDSYAVGGSTVATDTTLSNSSDAPVQVVLYHAFDCYTGDSDFGTGTSSDGSVSCVSDNVTANGAPTLCLTPLTAGSTYVEEFYNDLWSDISTGNLFSDTVEADDHDTAEGLAWQVTVPASGSVSVQYTTQLLLTQQ
jgi:hypothetical protein